MNTSNPRHMTAVDNPIYDQRDIVDVMYQADVDRFSTILAIVRIPEKKYPVWQVAACFPDNSLANPKVPVREWPKRLALEALETMEKVLDNAGRGPRMVGHGTVMSYLRRTTSKQERFLIEQRFLDYCAGKLDELGPGDTPVLVDV